MNTGNHNGTLVRSFLTFPFGHMYPSVREKEKKICTSDKKIFRKRWITFSLLLENSRKLQGFGLCYSSSGVMQGAEGQECQFTLDQRRGKKKVCQSFPTPLATPLLKTFAPRSILHLLRKRHKSWLKITAGGSPTTFKKKLLSKFWEWELIVSLPKTLPTKIVPPSLVSPFCHGRGLVRMRGVPEKRCAYVL